MYPVYKGVPDGSDKMAKASSTNQKKVEEKGWVCPSCGAVWPSEDFRDGYGCDNPSCEH